MALLSAAYLHTPRASRRRAVAPGRNMLLNAAPGQNMLLNAAPGRYVAETRCLLKHVIRRHSTPIPRHAAVSWRKAVTGGASQRARAAHARPIYGCSCPGWGPEPACVVRLGAPPIVAIVLQRHYDEWHSEMRDNCELKRFPGQNYCEIIAGLSIV